MRGQWEMQGQEEDLTNPPSVPKEEETDFEIIPKTLEEPLPKLPGVESEVGEKYPEEPQEA